MWPTLVFASEGIESFLLLAMAQDHYVDICHSLLLSQVMRNQLYVGLLFALWGLDFLDDCISIFGAANLEFCETHTIAHFSCELPSLFPLACCDVSTSLTALTWSYVICNLGTVHNFEHQLHHKAGVRISSSVLPTSLQSSWISLRFFT